MMEKENTLKVEEKEILIEKLEGLKDNYGDLFAFLEKNNIWDRSYSKGYEVTLIDSLGNTLLDVIDNYYFKHMPLKKNSIRSKIISLDFYGKHYLVRKKLDEQEFSVISVETNGNDNFNKINFEKILNFIENEIIVLK